MTNGELFYAAFRPILEQYMLQEFATYCPLLTSGKLPLFRSFFGLTFFS